MWVGKRDQKPSKPGCFFSHPHSAEQWTGLPFLSPLPLPNPSPTSQPHSASHPVHSNAGPLAPHPSSLATSASLWRTDHPWPCPPDDPTPPATAMATPKPRVSDTCSPQSLSWGPALSLPLLLPWDCAPVPSANHLLTIRPHKAPCPSFPPLLHSCLPLSLRQNPTWPCAQQPLPSSTHSAIYSLCPPFPSCIPPSTGTFKPEERVMVASHLLAPHIHSDINSAHLVSQTHLDAQGWLSGSAQQAEEPTTPRELLRELQGWTARTADLPCQSARAQLPPSSI